MNYKNLKKVSDKASKELWNRWRRISKGAGTEVPSWTFEIEGEDKTFCLYNCEDLELNEVIEILDNCRFQVEEIPVCNEYELSIINS